MNTSFQQEIDSLTAIQLSDQDQIGLGANGKVYRYKINSNATVAVKCFKNKDAAMEEKKVYEDIQKIAPNFPGIIGYYGIKQLDIEIKGTYTSKYSGYALFLQACENDFLKVDSRNLPIKEILNILSQLILPLICLHCNGIIHGDLKPANILINSIQKNQNKQFIYYLTDFGEGKQIGINTIAKYNSLTLRGTVNYFAPEL